MLNTQCSVFVQFLVWSFKFGRDCDLILQFLDTQFTDLKKFGRFKLFKEIKKTNAEPGIFCYIKHMTDRQNNSLTKHKFVSKKSFKYISITFIINMTNKIQYKNVCVCVFVCLSVCLTKQNTNLSLLSISFTFTFTINHWRIQGGHQDAPSESKFFHFYAVFGKKIAK